MFSANVTGKMLVYQLISPSVAFVLLKWRLLPFSHSNHLSFDDDRISLGALMFVMMIFSTRCVIWWMFRLAMIASFCYLMFSYVFIFLWFYIFEYFMCRIHQWCAEAGNGNFFYVYVQGVSKISI